MNLKSITIILLFLVAGGAFAADPERVFGCRSGLLHVFRTSSGFEYTFEANSLAAHGTARPNRQALSVDVEPFLRDSGCRKNTVARLEAAFQPLAQSQRDTSVWNESDDLLFLGSLIEAENGSAKTRDSQIKQMVGCVSQQCRSGSVCIGNTVVGIASVEVGANAAAPVTHPRALAAGGSARINQICNDDYICKDGRMQDVFLRLARRGISGYRRGSLPDSIDPENAQNKQALLNIVATCARPIGFAANNVGWTRGRENQPGTADAIETLLDVGVPVAQSPQSTSPAVHGSPTAN